MENLTLDTFRTINLKKWLVGKKVPIDDYEGFIKKDGNVVLFDHRKVKTFMDKDFIYVYFLSKENYDEFKQYNIKHTLLKMNSIIYYCNEDFFELKGKKNKDLRYAYNMYKNNIIIKNEVDIDGTKELIKIWRKVREGSHFRMNTADELYFLEKYYNSNLSTLSFYKDGKMVGYSVVEKIKDNIYNLLFRKTDVRLTQFTYFVDYMTLKSINDRPFYINVGDDGGKKKMFNYKTDNFPVHSITPSLSIKISNKKDVKPLFNLNG